MQSEILFSYREDGLHLHRTLTNKPSVDDFSFQSHSHNMYEIYLFLSGDADFAVEGRVFPLERGVLVFTLCGQTHNLLLKSGDIPYERAAILFSDKILPVGFDELLGQASKGGYIIKLDEAGVQWVLESISVLKNALEYGLNMREQIASLVTLLLSKITSESKDNTVLDETEDDLIKQIIRYIDRHLSEELSLDSIEKALYRDKAYLGRRFKEVMGCSIWEYIMRKRIFSARQQLYLTKSVSDAFSSSGFGDYSTFYRRYKKYVGISPSEDLKKFTE